MLSLKQTNQQTSTTAKQTNNKKTNPTVYFDILYRSDLQKA